MLLVPSRGEEPDEMDEADETTHLLHCHRRGEPATLRFMIRLTVSMLGLQIVWSVETSFVSPYMLSLGMSKNFLAFVLIAGPLSGIIVQPYIGALSDRFGRRIPFIVGGALATILCLFSLPVSNVAWAIALLVILDCAINTMQAGIRAFIVDNAPTNEQERANAWASRMSGLGNILGYLYSAHNWSKRGSVFSDNQFMNMSVVASGFLAATIFISFLDVKEVHRPCPLRESSNELSKFFSELWASLHQLPYQVRAVCYAQFFAWIGWFPILFYTTTYVGEIYAQPILEAHPHMTEREIEKVWMEGTRKGNAALFVFAVTSFVASVLLPLIIAKPSTNISKATDTSATSHHDNVQAGQLNGDEDGDQDLSNNLNHASRPDGVLTPPASPTADSPPSSAWRNLLTLKLAWVMSHIAFAILTVGCTFFVNTTTHATILIGLIGIPWAMTLWAPFALIAAEISQLHDSKSQNSSNTIDDHEDDAQEVVPQAGIVLGIHNVAIAAPQVISTIICSIIFRYLEKPRGTVGDESVAWVIRFCGLSAIVAAFVAGRVRDDGK